MIRHGSRRAPLAVLFGALLAIAAGCGGSPSANDPSGAVQAALSAATSGGLAKLSDYSCAAKKGDIANAFGGVDTSALQAAGIDVTDLLGAMSMKFENVSTTQVSKSDSAATVHLSADLTIAFEEDKMRTIMKTMLAAASQPVDDATLDVAMGAMSAGLSRSSKVDEDVQLVNEGGKWLLCS